MPALQGEVGRTQAQMGMWGGGSAAEVRGAGRAGRKGVLTIEDRFTGAIGLQHLRLSPGLADNRRTVNQQWWRGDECAVAVDDGETNKTADRRNAAGRSEAGLVPD